MNDKLLTESTYKKEYFQMKDALVAFIKKRLGLSIPQHQEKNLEKTVLNACNKFSLSPSGYINQLTMSADHSDLMEYFIAGVTIGETYFFRDQKQTQLLKGVILPQLINKKREENNLTLRIWSAGCSSGEEIYTIAILLNEMLPDIKKWTINLLGTDINTHSLKKAIDGSYTEWSMRSIPPYYKENYFSVENNLYKIIPEIKKSVNFSYLNLNENNYPSIFNGTNSQDIILCRNVLIYFDKDHIARLMRKFSQSLSLGGYLILGASDPVVTTNVDLVFHPKEGILFTRSVPKKILELNAREKNAGKIKKIHTLVSKTFPKKEPMIPHAVNNQMILELMSESKWQEALNLISENEDKLDQSPFLVTSKAMILANLGRTKDAANLCEEGLCLYPTDKEIYFIYALILVELNQIENAENILRKTLFLDRLFVPAHFQLGLLLLKNKKINTGIKCLKNALTIAQSKNPSDSVIGSQGLTYERLIDILKKEIDLYSASGINNYVNEKT